MHVLSEIREKFLNDARPLHKLTEAKQKFIWTVDCNNAFNKLKDALTSAPILAYPEIGKQFILDTDASHESIGAVLSQEIDGQERVIAYFSKCLSKPESYEFCVNSLNVAVTQSALKDWFTIKFRSIPTSLWTPPNKSSAPCACSEAVEKEGVWVGKTVKSKVVEHTRAAEAPDKKKRARLQADQVHHRLARATETPEQYQVRLQSQQVRQNASRAAETPEQRQSRLHDDQVHHRAARAAETPIQHVVHLLGLRRKRNVAITLKWRAQMYDGFMYNPRYDYESNNLLDIGRMSNVCHKCSALKWKGETQACAVPVVKSNCHQF
ncbi:retrovirus-related Pol polyprotein from transposon 412 [Trichonephila clavipes]|nr:retrovirus-related Pol polyprotein from transposon 412 [Trichonephila clavipes]